MKKLKKLYTTNGFILPIILISLSFMIWVFSIYLLTFREKSEKIKTRKNTNDRVWRLERDSIIGEYELYKGDLEINKGNYKDIIEYFEGKDRVWKKKGVTSSSGYSRESLFLNDKVIEKDIFLEKRRKNRLRIVLNKTIKTRENIYKVLVKLVYEYPLNELDLDKPSKREIEEIEVKSEKS